MSEHYTLYQYQTCGFCWMVRRFLESAGVEIPMKDTMLDPAARRELMEGGGRTTVPCLRIEQDDGSVRWMYESSDIIRYLREQLQNGALR